MAYECRIERDSINQWGNRLTTFVIQFPRIVLAEFNTHRMLSRNSASSRAIPVEKQIEKVEKDLFYPIHWGKNQKGMQAEEELSGHELEWSKKDWRQASDSAVSWAKTLLNRGVHKQITNRLLEPFMWHTAVVTATEWSNFFNLRDHKAAQPEIRQIAHMMNEVYKTSQPTLLSPGYWHLPFIDPITYAEVCSEKTWTATSALSKISAARCGRVSYLTHDGKRDYSADLAMYDRLVEPGHMSPLEHPARPMTESEHELFSQQAVSWNGSGWDHEFAYHGVHRKTHFLGNFQGWVQLRKLITGEHDMLGNR